MLDDQLHGPLDLGKGADRVDESVATGIELVPSPGNSLGKLRNWLVSSGQV
jgi:hypothetical protein